MTVIHQSLSKIITFTVLLCTLLISNHAYSNDKTVLLLGDSLSAGYGIDVNKSWFVLMQQELQQQQPDLTFINASISGDTTSGGLARLPLLLQTHKPEVLWIELGGNDGLRGYPIKRIEKNLLAMIKLAEEHQTQVIITEIQLPPNYGARYTREFQGLYHRISENHAVKLLPFFMMDIAGNDNLMLPDGIHPNENAQAQIKDTIISTLLPLL